MLTAIFLIFAGRCILKYYGNYSAPHVPNASHSGLWASRGASRLVRPGKKIKNVPESELPGTFLIFFPGC